MGLVISAFRLAVSSGYDADAVSYFAATGITDTTKKDALNDLVVGLKSDGLWSSSPGIYPFPGPTATENSVNLRSPGTYDLTFYGGLTHSSTGMLPDGSTGYADTGIVPSSALATSDTHLSYYSRTANTTNGYDIGCFSTVNYHALGLGCYYSSAGDSGYSFAYDGSFGYDMAVLPVASNPNSSGFYVGSRISASHHVLYKNGTAGTVNTLLTGDFPSITDTVKIGCMSHNGTPLIWGNRECAFASVGFGLTSTEAAALYSRVQTYQTALARQV